MARRGVLGVLVGGAAALLGGCNPFGGRAYRYRMTVEVDTSQGVKAGSAVRQVRFMRWANGGKYGYATGEAVVVDLDGGRALFALLTGADGDVDYAGHGMSAVFRQINRNGGNKSGPHELWPKVPVVRDPITNPLPLLVTFTDVDDPKSVQRVDPANLAASFGPGIHLKRITVEVTDDDVTTGIGKRLRWFGGYKDRQLDGHRYNNSITLAISLNRLAFSQGLQK